MTPEEAAVEALEAMPSMFRELSAVMDLEQDHPRRLAAIAEKHRVLDLIAFAEPRLALNT